MEQKGLLNAKIGSLKGQLTRFQNFLEEFQSNPNYQVLSTRLDKIELTLFNDFDNYQTQLSLLDPEYDDTSARIEFENKYYTLIAMAKSFIENIPRAQIEPNQRVLSNDNPIVRLPPINLPEFDGLICAEGDLWKDQRRFVHKCLRNLGCTKSGTQRKNMEELILAHVMDFIKHIKQASNGHSIDPLEPLRHSMGSVINEIVFGTHWSSEDEIWKWLQELQEDGTKLIGVAGPLNFLPCLRFLPMFKRVMSFLIEGKLKTHQFYQKLIEEEKEKIPSNKSRSVDLDTNIAYTNLIQGFLIEREKRRNTDDVDKYYNDQQFYHLLADVFGAGLDTTLTTLRWFILFMAMNEEIQVNIRKEIKSILGDRLPTMQDLSCLPLTEASIAETQRIRPVVPIGIPHGAIADIEIDGYIIPRGSMIIPLQWAVHMNQTQYLDPLNFNPHNFLNEEGKFRKNDYFIPFQIGKRKCVGDELAKMLLFLFCVPILQAYHLSFEAKENVDVEGECGITLTPKPHKIRFEMVN